MPIVTGSGAQNLKEFWHFRKYACCFFWQDFDMKIKPRLCTEKLISGGGSQPSLPKTLQTPQLPRFPHINKDGSHYLGNRSNLLSCSRANLTLCPSRLFKIHIIIELYLNKLKTLLSIETFPWFNLIITVSAACKRELNLYLGSRQSGICFWLKIWV